MRRALLSLTIALALLIGAVHLLDIPLANGLRRVSAPIGAWMNQAGSRFYRIGSELSDLGSLRSRLEAAEDEVTRLRLRTIGQERLEAENRQLREELAFMRTHELDIVMADIINYQPDGSRDMLRINLGSEDGITPQMAVVSNGVLVGVVKEVMPRSAGVLLVSDVSFRAVVEVGETSGVMRGQVGGGMIVERLPRNQGIKSGDLVITSGQDGVFPPGLLIGSVRSLAQAPGGIFDTAQITPERLARELQVVGVVRE